MTIKQEVLKEMCEEHNGYIKDEYACAVDKTLAKVGEVIDKFNKDNYCFCSIGSGELCESCKESEELKEQLGLNK